VQTGIEREGYVEIVSGLSSVIDVIIGGKGRLAQGTPVEIQSAATQSSTQPSTRRSGI
jgi:hypothetical protein